MPQTFNVRVFSKPEEVYQAVAQLLREEMALIEKSGIPQAIMLTGGSTPIEAYRMLAKEEIGPVNNLTLFMSDERLVPMDSDQNNHNNASAFIDSVCPNPDQQIRVQTDLDRKTAAQKFHADLDMKIVEPKMPIPLGLMGLGADGHTAGVFTNENLSSPEGQWALDVDRPDQRIGISVTKAFFPKVDRLVFQTTGSSKEEAIYNLLHNPEHSTAAKAVSNCNHLELWMDETAAKKI